MTVTAYFHITTPSIGYFLLIAKLADMLRMNPAGKIMAVSAVGNCSMLKTE
jgi:hypothetical protein